jgi:hypothetical protein
MTHVPDLEHHRKEAAEARAAKLLVKRPDLFAKAGSELPLKCPGPDVAPYHLDRETAFTVEHLGDACTRSDQWLQVLPRQPPAAPF